MFGFPEALENRGVIWAGEEELQNTVFPFPDSRRDACWITAWKPQLPAGCRAWLIDTQNERDRFVPCLSTYLLPPPGVDKASWLFLLVHVQMPEPLADGRKEAWKHVYSGVTQTGLNPTSV